MASNPMQRQKKYHFGKVFNNIATYVLNSYWRSRLYAIPKNRCKKRNEKSMVQVYTLTTDVSSGQVVTSDMLKMLTVSRRTVPAMQ